MPELKTQPLTEKTDLYPKSRRPAEPVLIVEDREENQMLLAGICDRLEIPYEVAENGSVGLAMAKSQSFSLFIVDLLMPIMDGKTFVKLLKEQAPDSVILIQTAIDSSEEVIEIMKMGVYDYLVKPLNLEIFKVTLRKALEYRYLLNIEKNLVKEESKELRDHLEWLNYKEASRKNAENTVEMAAIHNLNTTLLQGSGFGSMTTLIDSIAQFSTTIDDSWVKVDKAFLNLVVENNEYTKSMLRGLVQAVFVLDNPIILSNHVSSELQPILSLHIEEMKDFLNRKSLVIHAPLFKTDYPLRMDLSKISRLLQEILLNACKYSPPSTHIDIFITILDGYFCLSIKNTVLGDAYGNLAEKTQKSLIRPFFRVAPPVEEVHSKEQFGLGLGLTVVDYIANQHHGMFFIRNAKDHTTETLSLCMIAELFLPIQNLSGVNKT